MSERIDQLDMALRMELLAIRREFSTARTRARHWRPRPCPK